MIEIKRSVIWTRCAAQHKLDTDGIILAQRSLFWSFFVNRFLPIYTSKFLVHKFQAQQFPLAEKLRSIDALPLLQQKLEARQLNAGSQLAHVCNRFFSVLESKGILRTATEEFLLASKYNPHDELSAEFIRTFREHRFMGMSYLQRYDLVLKGLPLSNNNSYWSAQ